MFRELFEKMFSEEELEWMLMSPSERMEESQKLLAKYLYLGGSLDPEPDPQSPFYFPEDQNDIFSYWRTGGNNVQPPKYVSKKSKK